MIDELIVWRTASPDYVKYKYELRLELEEALSNILLGESLPLDFVDSDTGEIVLPANRKITKIMLKEVAKRYSHIDIDPSPIANKIREIFESFKLKFEELEKIEWTNTLHTDLDLLDKESLFWLLEIVIRKLKGVAS